MKNIIKNLLIGSVATLLISTNVFAIGETVYPVDGIPVREEPCEESNIVAYTHKDKECIVVEDADEYDWVKIRRGNKEGYIGKQFLFYELYTENLSIFATVSSEFLFVMSGPGDEYEVIETLDYGEVIEIPSNYNMINEWIEINFYGGLGYINSFHITFSEVQETPVFTNDINEDYVPETYEEIPAFDSPSYVEENAPIIEYIPEDIPIEEEISAGEVEIPSNFEEEQITEILPDNDFPEISEEEIPTDFEEIPEDFEDMPTFDEDLDMEFDYIIDEELPSAVNNYSGIAGTANQYLGVDYVWGGTSPNGFDCSGLTQYSYAQNGITIPRVAADQYYAGTQISIEEAINTPGALIFYDDLGHVAISNGDGTITHAADYGIGVTTSDAYYMTPYGAVIY